MTFPSQSKYVLIGDQGTAGTAGTSGTASISKDAGLIITDVTDEINREVIETSGISKIETQKVSTGMVDDGISFEGAFQHGRLFKYILGEVASVQSTNDWTHTFTIAEAPHIATIESGDSLSSDVVLKHVNQMIESAELSTALNENVKLSVTFKGNASNSSQTAQTAVLSTLPIFPHSLVTVTFDNKTANEVQNASISFNKVIERSGGLGSNIYQQTHPTELKIEFNANLGFFDGRVDRLMLSGTAGVGTAATTTEKEPSSFDFKINANNGVTLGSGRREIEVELKNCYLSTYTKTASVGGLTFIDITGIGTLNSLFTVDNITDVLF